NNPSVNRPVEITEGKDKIYEWVSDTIIFEIRDGGKIDGDVVSVSFNNNIVLHNYTLTKGVKRILLPLSGKEVDAITIIAGNEGNEPPNAADIMLQDGDRLYEIIAHNKIGKKANILIRRKK